MSFREQLQALSVFQWVLTFLFFGIFFASLLAYLLFTPYWSITVLYFAWWICDWETPERGGRRSDWMRRWKIWELHRDYFPIKLVKTAELPPTQNYILGCHPHGIICAGAFSAFCTEATGFSRTFPGLHPSLALLAGLFHLPVYRDYMMSSGMVPVSKRALDYLLQAGPGHAVVIVVGGAAESLDCAPGEQRVRLRGRRGFVRLALQHGADLVPVYSFGENDIFRQLQFPEGSLARRLQLWFKQLAGFAPCLFAGRGLFCSRSWGLLPLASPITVVVGKPLPVPCRPHPTEEEVDCHHARYVAALQQLFEAHKGRCGLPASLHLTIT
ncbi:2-acylglycerol O-acyltransferase 3 [Hemicordylus capensis]|uniref:2-acylglycerol O-acyltransferase 3 n=1 Tax=Hemicordylus capensis TaxID=884348 RepID=UPI0023036456|nr:2-acylglycerol O-acyltransferase 3 [Hemicordylus capensis]XP_053121938.1 2-acylglycerol O-acyltransferase 3 [Hemicordylus capensis]XP_053121939.1 2-acylglycerol O-acyltransferase 3 [Hemicordylus capensis]XP_053121940.1 2-acylglycerol O-acyltransferase 3 [Hemicordylus capensis]